MAHISLKRLFLLVLVFTSALSQGTTKLPALLCKKQCSYFHSNGDKFSKHSDMARNMSNLVLYAQSFKDIVNGFQYYSGSFKSDNMLNFFTYRELGSYRKQLIKHYGEQEVNDYFKGSYESPCIIDQGSLTYEWGDMPSYDMFQNLDLPDDIHSLAYANPAGLSVAFRKFFHLVAYENYPIRLLPIYDLDYQMVCLFGDLLPNARNTLVLNAPKNLTNNLNSQQHFRMIADEDILGFANLLVYAKFEDQIVQAYRNCINLIYDTNC